MSELLQLGSIPVSKVRSHQEEVERLRTGTVSAHPHVVGAIALRNRFSQVSDAMLADYRPRENVATPDVVIADGIADISYAFQRPLSRRFREAVTIIAKHEHSSYPDAVYSKVRLAVQQNQVGAGQSQRGSLFDLTLHRDGVASLPVRTYMVSDHTPTEFYAFDYVMPGADHIPVAGYMDLFLPEQYQIVAADSTTMHRAAIADEDNIRTFLRMTYELQI